MHIREWVSTDALPRSTKPGRMQVMLEIGVKFRTGRDLQLRLGSSSVEFLKGLSDRLKYTVIGAILNPPILRSGDF